MHPLARRNAQPELAQPARDAPRQRLGAEPAGDLDRLDEALLVVEQREHQRTVIRPADVAEGVCRPAPVAPEHRRMRCGLRWVELDRDPGDGRTRCHPNRAPADQTAGRPGLVQQRLEPLGRHRRAGGQRPLGLELDERRQTLRLARANGLRREIGEALGRIRVAAAYGQLGERRLGDELRDADALLELGARDPFGLVPLPCPQLQPRERDGDVRGEVVHLVLLGVDDRLPGIPNRRLGLRPGHQCVAEVAESARRLVLVADLVRKRVRLEEWRDLLVVDVEGDAAEIDQHVGAGALVAEPGRELERSFPPEERLVVVLREILELGEAAVGAGKLDRLAERLEDLDRLERLRARGIAVARVPVEPGQDLGAAANRCGVAQDGPLRDRALDRTEGVIEPVDRVGGGRQLFERRRPLVRGQPVEERRRAAVVGVRLAVRVDRRRAPRRHERIVGDDALGARRFGVVDDVGRVGVGRQERRKDLGVEPPSGRDRDARPDRVARELVAELHVPRVNLEQRPALRLLRSRRPVGQDGVEHGGGDTVRDDRDELDEPPFVVGEPGEASTDGVRNRTGQLVGRAGGEQLRDVERVAPGRGVDVVGTVAGERRDRARGERLELEHRRRRGENGVYRMARRRLTVPAREQEQHRERADAAREQGDHIQRRLVGPVHVLEHEHGRPRR